MTMGYNLFFKLAVAPAVCFSNLLIIAFVQGPVLVPGLAPGLVPGLAPGLVPAHHFHSLTLL